MNSLLNRLVNIKLADNPTKESKKEEKEVATRKRVEKNPINGADVRIMSSGKVYPSVDFATKYGLEYQNKNSNTISNGIDLFNALNWTNYSKAGNTDPLLLGYVIRQDQPKVELFAGIRYDGSGTPINSVLDQGSILSEDTLNMIAESLGYTGSMTGDGSVADTSAWENMIGDKRFIDLKFEETGDALKTSDGKYFIPKAINKGEKKGELTTIKREGISLMLVSEFTGTQESDNQPLPQEEGEDVPTNELTQDIEVGNQEAPEFEDLLEVHKQFEEVK